MTLMNKMQNKVKEIGVKVSEHKVSSEVMVYIKTCKKAHGIAIDLKGDKHLAFYPMYQALDNSDMDARLWYLLYDDLSKSFGLPPEVFNCMKLSTNGNAVVFEGALDTLTDDDELSECYYALSLIGIEEEWWDMDELVGLPSRMEAVLGLGKAMTQMQSFESMIAGVFGEDSESQEPEGWVI